MRLKCPTRRISCTRSGQIKKWGSYYRTSDRKKIQRYRCASCGLHFSQATTSSSKGQKKRHLNKKIYDLLCSGVSQRRTALILGIHQITVARKFRFLALQKRWESLKLRKKHPKVIEWQFDDLETFEHTKLKPLSVTMAVEKDTRFILGFEVSRMPAKGLLAKKSLKKYGRRKDGRKEARDRLFRKIQSEINEKSIVESDQNPHYPASVKKYFPKAEHMTTPGRRGCVVGQGELKAGGFDPIFTLNHTFAMYRANINRLFRKTWCTTKTIQGLIDHIELYVHFHNTVVITQR